MSPIRRMALTQLLKMHRSRLKKFKNLFHWRSRISVSWGSGEDKVPGGLQASITSLEASSVNSIFQASRLYSTAWYDSKELGINRCCNVKTATLLTAAWSVIMFMVGANAPKHLNCVNCGNDGPANYRNRLMFVRVLAKSNAKKRAPPFRPIPTPRIITNPASTRPFCVLRRCCAEKKSYFLMISTHKIPE